MLGTDSLIRFVYSLNASNKTAGMTQKEISYIKFVISVVYFKSLYGGYYFVLLLSFVNFFIFFFFKKTFVYRKMQFCN